MQQLTDYIPMLYVNAKSTLKVVLSFNKVEKTKRENFNFAHFLSFFYLKMGSRLLARRIGHTGLNVLRPC